MGHNEVIVTVASYLDMGLFVFLWGSQYLHAGGCKRSFLMGGKAVLFDKRSIYIS